MNLRKAILENVFKNSRKLTKATLSNSKMFETLYFLIFLSVLVNLGQTIKEPSWAATYCDNADVKRRCLENKSPRQGCGEEAMKLYPDKYAGPAVTGLDYLGKTYTEKPISPALQQKIVDNHNEVRNLIALQYPAMVNMAGDQYPRAAKMMKLQWNDDLAWTASQNTRKCIKLHDCGMTPDFWDVGQNMASNQIPSKGLLDRFNETDFVLTRPTYWWVEYVNMKIESVQSYSSKAIIKQTSEMTSEDIKHMVGLVKDTANDRLLISKIGHFGQIARDKINYIGCAFADCGAKGSLVATYHLVCNYDYGNFPEAVYEPSNEPGSQCKKKSLLYCGLCLHDKDKSEDSLKGPACRPNTIKVPTFVPKNPLPPPPVTPAPFGGGFNNLEEEAERREQDEEDEMEKTLKKKEDKDEDDDDDEDEEDDGKIKGNSSRTKSKSKAKKNWPKVFPPCYFSQDSKSTCVSFFVLFVLVAFNYLRFFD